MSASSNGWVMEDKKAESTLIEAIQQLHGLNRQFKNIFSEQLKPSQLTDSEFLVMWWCYQSEGEPIVQGELAVQVGLSPAQLSGIVDRLNKRSLLHLTRSTRDRRCQLLQLTPEGIQSIQDALRCIGTLSQVAADLGADQWLEQTNQLVDQLMALSARLRTDALDASVEYLLKEGAAA